MMRSEISIEQVKDSLRAIVGLKLFRSRNFCETRHFCFGDSETSSNADRARFTIGVECPWRIERAGRIIVGSDDYHEKADDNADADWEPGSPAGHLQDQKLAELFGEIKNGDIVTLKPGFLVAATNASDPGDLSIDFGQTCLLRIIPVSSRRMQWIIMSATEPSIMLVNGLLRKSTKTKG